MMFAGGNILPQEELPTLLDTLEERLNETRSGPPLDVDVVLDAVDSLGRALDSGELDPLLAQYAPPSALEELREVRGMIRREALEERESLRLRQVMEQLRAWGTDCTALGSQVAQANPARWEKLRGEWEERFSTIPYEVSVQVSVSRTYGDLA